MDNDEVRELADEQVEGIAGGYIYPDSWSKITDMAREKKNEGMSRNQFQEYLWKWRAETKMEGFTTGNLNRDFDSFLEYCYEEWDHF